MLNVIGNMQRPECFHVTLYIGCVNMYRDYFCWQKCVCTSSIGMLIRAGVKYVFVFANTNTNTAYLYLNESRSAYLYLIQIIGVFGKYTIKYTRYFTNCEAITIAGKTNDMNIQHDQQATMILLTMQDIANR